MGCESLPFLSLPTYFDAPDDEKCILRGEFKRDWNGLFCFPFPEEAIWQCQDILILFTSHILLELLFLSSIFRWIRTMKWIFEINLIRNHHRLWHRMLNEIRAQRNQRLEYLLYNKFRIGRYGAIGCFLRKRPTLIVFCGKA